VRLSTDTHRDWKQWPQCAKIVCYVPYDQYHNDRPIYRAATKFKSSISMWIQSTDNSVRSVMNPGKCRNSTQLSQPRIYVCTSHWYPGPKCKKQEGSEKSECQKATQKKKKKKKKTRGHVAKLTFCPLDILSLSKRSGNYTHKMLYHRETLHSPTVQLYVSHDQHNKKRLFPRRSMRVTISPYKGHGLGSLRATDWSFIFTDDKGQSSKS
jgi:hypothetical protein